MNQNTTHHLYSTICCKQIRGAMLDLVAKYKQWVL